jgi:hypothetical protein
MQVGLITVGGIPVGVVNLTQGDADTWTPEFGGYEHEGRDWQSGLGLAPHHPHAPRHPHEPSVSHGHGHAAHTEDRAKHHTSRGTPARADDGVGEGLTGSSYLAARRQRFADEMRDNPALREQVAGMLVTEGERDPVPVAESLFNRMDYSGSTVQRGLHSGFYGPINRGELPAAISQLHRNPELRERMDRAIDAALGGSNLIRGATDQGLPTDPNGMWQGGRIDRHHGNIFNDWGGGPGGHAGSRAYRENLQRRVTDEEAGAAHPDPSTTEGSIVPPSMGAAPGPQSSIAAPYQVASAVQDPKYTSEDINELIGERGSGLVGGIDTHKPNIHELDKTYDSPQQERFNRPYAYPPGRDKDPTMEPQSDKDRKAPPSQVYPPTPGDKYDPNKTKDPDGFGIPQDYDIG